MKKLLFRSGRLSVRGLIGSKIAVALVALALSASALPSRHDITIVVGSGKSQLGLSRRDIQMIFTGRSTHFLESHSVQVIILPRNNPTTATFVREHLSMTQSEFFKHVETYNRNAPATQIIIAPSEHDAIRMMTKPGCTCIGYISDRRLLLDEYVHEVTTFK